MNNQPTIAELVAKASSKRKQETVKEFGERMKESADILPPTITEFDTGHSTGIANCNAITNGQSFHQIMSDSSGEY